jgi:hypothetical protein
LLLTALLAVPYEWAVCFEQPERVAQVELVELFVLVASAVTHTSVLRGPLVVGVEELCTLVAHWRY